MSPSDRQVSSRWSAALWLLGGVLLALAAWAVPVNLKSVTPALLRAAGEGTPSVADFGRQLLVAEKFGSAELALAAAQAVGDPGAARLAEELGATAARQPELVPWGGWDPFLDPLFNLRETAGRTESTPVLTFFVTEKARESLRAYLQNSRSLGVQSVLKTGAIDRTTQFIPATRAGGQPLDAVILLTALLYQGEHLSPSLQRELRGLAETALAREDMGALEDFYIDLLSLARRLNWIQLGELLRRTNDVQTVSEYAHLSRVASDNLPLLYTAALFSNSADRVAAYLLQYGHVGLEDLRLALGEGQGAVRQLLSRQAPVNRAPSLSVGVISELSLLHPWVALTAKWLGFFVGAFAVFRGLDRWLFPADRRTVLPRMKSGVLATLCALLLIIGTEPFLLKAAPPSEYQIRLVVPVLANVADPESLTPTEPILSMDTSTLLSIAFFASLQVGMYLMCLLKIRDIAASSVSSLVKLRLMENEENLFDGGLYIGIAGTAAALVLQVLGVIEPNLLAAYSSNLFGIICVAMVKIRHVRPYKRRLILEGQAGIAAAAEAQAKLEV